MGNYTTGVKPSKADAHILFLVRHTQHEGAHIIEYEKVYKRLFNYYNDTRSTEHDIEWEPEVDLDRTSKSERSHFTTDELGKIFNASITYNSVKNYRTEMSSEERDALKT